MPGNVFVITCDMLRGVYDYVVKDMCIYNISTNAIQLFSFLPPYPETELPDKSRKTNEYLIKKKHGIRWKQGFIEYLKLTSVIRSYVKPDDVVYCKGLEMVRILKGFAPKLDIRNMESEIEEKTCKMFLGIQAPLLSLDNVDRCFSRSLKLGYLMNMMMMKSV